jgi:hypothetical protein
VGSVSPPPLHDASHCHRMAHAALPHGSSHRFYTAHHTTAVLLIVPSPHGLSPLSAIIFSLQRVHTHHTDHMLVVVVIAGFTWGPGSPVVTTKTASLVEWTSTGTSTGSTTKGVTATVNGSLWMDG